MKFSSIKALISDMDGVLWRGEQGLPGLLELFAWLTEHQIPYILATNNSGTTQAEYVAKLARLGVHGVTPDHIVTSAIATADYMRARYPAGTRVYVIGMNGIREALIDSGFDLDDDPGEWAQVVVCGIDFDLTYEKLKRATLHLRHGADFIGTNADRTFPHADGIIPGAGSLLAALQTASDRVPTIIGKPYPAMFEAALLRLGTTPSQTLMIGDRLDTDIQGAQALGMQTALVFTGVTQASDMITSQAWADVAYEDLASLVRAWAGDEWYRAQIKARRG